MKQKLRTIWKQIIAPFFLCLMVMSLALTFTARVNAQGASGVITNVGKQTGLPSYDTSGHANASFESGASNITSAIFYVIDFVKYIAGTLAVVTIIISGVRLITAGRKVEEVATAQKEHLKMALIGLIVIIAADQFVLKAIFGTQGEIYSSKTTLQEAAQAGSQQIRGIYDGMAYFAGSVAILMIVIAGFKYMTAAGNEDAQGKAKKQIIYALVGLIVIGLAEYVVRDVIFPSQGAKLSNIEAAKSVIVSLTNFIAGFLSTVSAIMFIYGGYQYVTAFGKEEATGNAKKTLLGAVIGLILAMSAFAIVNTVVQVKSDTTAGSGAPASLPTSGNVGGP